MSSLDVHILHDASGRILAIAPAAPLTADSGASRGVTPVPGDGQFALRLTLTEEHTAAGPVALVREFEVDLTAARPSLRPRTT